MARAVTLDCLINEGLESKIKSMPYLWRVFQVVMLIAGHKAESLIPLVCYIIERTKGMGQSTVEGKLTLTRGSIAS